MKCSVRAAIRRRAAPNCGRHGALSALAIEQWQLIGQCEQTLVNFLTNIWIVLRYLQN